MDRCRAQTSRGAERQQHKTPSLPHRPLAKKERETDEMPEEFKISPFGQTGNHSIEKRLEWNVTERCGTCGVEYERKGGNTLERFSNRMSLQKIIA